MDEFSNQAALRHATQGGGSVIDQAAKVMLGLDEYGKTQQPVPPTAMKLMLIDLHIADCHTRRKAAIMRAAAATKEV